MRCSGCFEQALFFIDSDPRKIPHLLAQTGEHIENGAFTGIRVAK